MTDTKQDIRSTEDQQPHAIDLYTLSAKIFAIGELIKFRGGEPSLEEERVNYGIGAILVTFSNEIDSISPK